MVELRFTIDQTSTEVTEKVIVRLKEDADDDCWVHAGTLFLPPAVTDLLRDLMRAGADGLDDTTFEKIGDED
jgi:hypothetical protein